MRVARLLGARPVRRLRSSCRVARDERSHATARRHRADGQGSARQQRRQSVSRHPGLGTVRCRSTAVGRLQRRGHRPRRQVGVGDRPMLAGNDAGLSRQQGQSGSPFRRVREGDQELWRRDVRVAAWHPRRSRWKRVGDRRTRRHTRRSREVSRRRQQGKRRRQVQSGRQGPDDARETRRAGEILPMR